MGASTVPRAAPAVAKAYRKSILITLFISLLLDLVRARRPNSPPPHLANPPA